MVEGKICRSRDSLIPVFAFRILNSKGRGFLKYSLSRTFQPTISYDALVSQIFFLRKLTSYLVFALKSTVLTILKRSIIVYLQPASQAIEADAFASYCDPDRSTVNLVKYPYIYDFSVYLSSVEAFIMFALNLLTYETLKVFHLTTFTTPYGFFYEIFFLQARDT